MGSSSSPLCGSAASAGCEGKGPPLLSEPGGGGKESLPNGCEFPSNEGEFPPSISESTSAAPFSVELVEFARVAEI
eukprot:9478609-Pyramimonas_sp.AAC.1